MERTLIGVLGAQWRARVSSGGRLDDLAGRTVLDWAVAADDRWHRPDEEVAVRQTRLAGAPVVETRVRIPGGDAVQRVWAVADGGGRTMVEVANESPLPIACAFTRADLLTSRPPTDVPIEGIDLPAGSIVVPIGHRTSVTIALAHDGTGPGPLPPGWSGAEAVARGWQAVVERAGRLELPDPRLAEAVTAARSDLLLDATTRPDDDPALVVLTLAELARPGELPAGDLALEVAGAVESLARGSATEGDDGWRVDAALDAAALVLHRLGEHRAVDDVAHIVARRHGPVPPPVVADVGELASAAAAEVPSRIERLLVARGQLFPGGIPTAWRGAPIEAHGIPAGPATTVSFAVRWHGELPAVLWEADGEPCPLRATAVDPSWSSNEPAGEALWRLAGATAATTSVAAVSDAPTSFS